MCAGVDMDSMLTIVHELGKAYYKKKLKQVQLAIHLKATFSTTSNTSTSQLLSVRVLIQVK